MQPTLCTCCMHCIGLHVCHFNIKCLVQEFQHSRSTEVPTMARVGRPPSLRYMQRWRSAWRRPDRIYMGRMGLMQSHGLANKIPFKRAKFLANPKETSGTQTY